MICKELDPPNGTDKFNLAGRKAEEQLAFYLRRAFGHKPDVRVFNNLRFEWDDDVAQIDHLVLHPNGMIIVESKSVVGEVSVNELGEWTRSFGGPKRGMPSPVLQAQRQRDFLKRYLEAHVEMLLRKLLGIQMQFNDLRIDLLVAISDSGIIHRKGEIPELCKADQVPDRVQALLDKSRKANSILNILNEGTLAFSKDSTERITQFFLDRHRPSGRVSAPVTSAAPQSIHEPAVVGGSGGQRPAQGPTPPQSVSPSPPQGTQTATRPPAAGPPPTGDETPTRCKNCSGTDVRILYGKYGYYFKCNPCGANTNIRVICPSCGRRARLHKDNLSFSVECEGCGARRPYFTNPI